MLPEESNRRSRGISDGIAWPVAGLALLALLIIGAICFRPAVRYLQWMRSGQTAPEFLHDQVGPAIMLEVGVLVDGEFVGGDEPVRVTSGTELRPDFRVTNIPRSEVSDIEFWLDGVRLPGDQPFELLEAWREPYLLRAQGRSDVHDATFRGQCFIMVLESTIDDN